MADFRVTAFLDYSSTLWSAQKLFGQKECQELDPCALALAVCDELVPPGLTASLATVHVYTSKPHKASAQCERRRHRDWRARALKRARHLDLRVKILDPPQNYDGEAKEVHTQLTVDLVKWAFSAARIPNRSGSNIAVLFSNDRQCRPAVLKVAERLALANAGRIDIAGWTGQEHSKLDHAWIAALDPPTKVHSTRWESYQRHQ